MITQGAYVHYKTMNSSEEVENWVNEGTPIISNHSNYEREIQVLNEWKNAHKRNYQPRKDGKEPYKNIFAYCLVFLIPYELEKDKYDLFVKKYAEKVSKNYKAGKKKAGLLWCAKYFTINKANYVELVCFSRKVYEKSKVAFKKYTQDYWFDNKGNRCKATTEGAVLKGKKGDFILDKKGKKIRVIKNVKSVNEDKTTFRYKNFDKFTYKLKKKWMKVASKMCDRKEYLLISKQTIKEDDSQTMRKAYLKLNSNIDKINDILKEYQNSLEVSGFNAIDGIYKSFYELLNEIDNMIHKKYVEFSKVKEFIQDWWIREVAGDWIKA
ncbi:MAG: hypothetical protein K2P09_02915 [Erysipelotrichales bacterium]|nr:hypothetical protein [Erysipelotrichales bacterium]